MASTRTRSPSLFMEMVGLIVGLVVAGVFTGFLWVSVLMAMGYTGLIRGPRDPGRATAVEAWLTHGWPLLLMVELFVGCLVAKRVCSGFFRARSNRKLPKSPPQAAIASRSNHQEQGTPNDRPTRARGGLRRAGTLLFWAAMLLYVLAWFLPPLADGTPPSGSPDRREPTALFVFAYTIMMLFHPPSGTMGWGTWKLMGLTGATNFVVPVAVACMVHGRRQLPVGILLLACGLLDLLWMYWLPLDGRASLGVGYFVWISSLWLLAFACVVGARAQTQTVSGGLRPD